MNNQKSDILFSRTVKAGQRYYYIDAKIDTKGNRYIVLTESKNAEKGQSMLRSKVFLYEEDFAKFREALDEVFSALAPNSDSIYSSDAHVSNDLARSTDSSVNTSSISLIDMDGDLDIDLDLLDSE